MSFYLIGLIFVYARWLAMRVISFKQDCDWNSIVYDQWIYFSKLLSLALSKLTVEGSSEWTESDEAFFRCVISLNMIDCLSSLIDFGIIEICLASTSLELRILPNRRWKIELGRNTNCCSMTWVIQSNWFRRVRNEWRKAEVEEIKM